MTEKICCIFNVAPHYNASIYLIIDREYACDFYIGDRLRQEIKLMDYTKLKGFKSLLKNQYITRKLYWQWGILRVLSKKYSLYIITGEFFSLSNWVILFLNFVMNKKVILWSHGWYGRENILKSIIKKIFFGMSDVVFLYGQYAKKLMEKEGIDPRKLICIYNSTNYDTQLQVRSKLTNTSIYKDYFNNDLPTVIYVGRIQRAKRLEILFESLENLNQSTLKANIVIIGPYVEITGKNIFYKQKISNNNAWIYGECYDEEKLGELIFNAAVCVSPGNVGLTAIHSLMYGTPVITHDNFSKQMPEFEAIIENQTGNFYEENSIIDLSTKLKKWIKISASEREEVRKKCYKVIDEKYNPHKQIEIINKTLSKFGIYGKNHKS